MKTVLPYGVLLAYLMTWLSFLPDEQGPVIIYLPFLAMANWEAISSGGRMNPRAFIPLICGLVGGVLLLVHARGYWKGKWAAITACAALLISEGAFVAGTAQRTLSAMTALPFLILSLILVGREICSGQRSEATP